MEKTRTPTMKSNIGSSSKLIKEKDEKMKMQSATSKVKFAGWRTKNPKEWESWVNEMCSLHRSTWENAGIYEAIMSSKYIIKRQDNLILELGSRWCSKTNTFVFPWGKATLTLEDMLILGGFSASGVSALTSLDNDAKSRRIKEQLELARVEIIRTKSKVARHSKWLEKFIESGGELEHAAFLSLWLSRHVFPVSSCHSTSINKRVLPVAARLSRGIQIALGPAVLAMLYRDLGVLGKRIRFTQMVDQSGETNLCAAFHLVQIWAWERFPMLKPVPNCMYLFGDFPRLARWSNVRIRSDKDLRSAIDSAEKAFLWCPYGSSFGWCVEAIELIGFDSCIEKYQPERVARQFGLEQKQQRYSTSSLVKVEKAVDCVPPGFTPRIEVIDVSDSDHDCSVEMASCSNTKTYGGAATFQPTITAFCERWRKQQRHSTISQVKVESEVDCGPPPGFPPQIEVPSEVDSDSDFDFDSDDDSELRGTTMDVVNGSVHGTRDDEGEVELATGCDSGLELEARVSRLEDIVYAHIKALEAAK